MDDILGAAPEPEDDVCYDGEMGLTDIDLRELFRELDGYEPTEFGDLSAHQIDKLQLYRIISNQIPQRLFWKDLNLRYVWANRRFANDCGVDSPEDLVGQTDIDMPWTIEQSIAFQADDRVVMASKKPKINIIEQQLRPDGSTAWLHTNKVPLFNKSGEVIGVIGTYEDITERTQAEIALRQYQQMVESIFNHIPSAVFWKDRNLNYGGCNIHFARDAGLASQEDIVGLTDEDLPWTAQQVQFFRADDISVIKRGQPKLNYVEEQTGADGKVSWLQVNKVPLFDADGKVTGVLGTYQNITEQIEAREALRRSRLAILEERQVLARELHDAVSQTLWTASLMADVLPVVWDKDREEGEKNLEQLRRLTKGALAEMRMLLLELRPASLIETDFEELMDRLAEATMSRKKLEIEVSAEIGIDMPPDVKIGLYRIAQESLNNIVRHSRATHAKIIVHSVEDGVRIVIEDNGRGFNVEHSAPERMGLNIMQERASGIQADLDISSQVGEGTQVTIFWTRDKETL